MPIKHETDLYAPVKQFLESQGLTVRGEVNGCDIVAIDEKDHVTIVELKKTFNLELLIQGVDRLKIGDSIYVAIEKPKVKRNGKRWTNIVWICSQLGLGLITVQFGRYNQTVEVVCEAGKNERKNNLLRKAKLVKETRGRSGDHNKGGSTKLPIVTAYREEAIACALYLRETGPSKLSDIKKAIANEKARAILYENHYGWFMRQSRGIYGLTDEGYEALKHYKYVYENKEK